MSDNEQVTSTVPALPDFERAKQSVQIVGYDGNEYSLEGDSVFDYIPESGNYLPRLCAGQADDSKGSYKEGKVTHYPLAKTLYLEYYEYGETADSEKPVTTKGFRVLPYTSGLMIPIAVDASRRYWKNAYDAANVTEPDCQSNAAFFRPMPDERYLTRDDKTGRILGGKVSHACMSPNAAGKLVDHCPMCKWENGERPKCVFYIHVYGLIPNENNELELVETRFKRASFKSGEKLMRHLRELNRQHLPLWSNQIKLVHEKASEDKTGYTYYGIVQPTPFTPDADTLALIVESQKQADTIIESNRSRAFVRGAATTVIDGEIVTPDMPF